MTRGISWAMAALAYLGMPAWACVQLRSFAAEAHDVPVCGMPAMAMMITACLGAAILSMLGFGFGLLAHSRLPSPRPWRRVAELAVIAAPMIPGAFLAGLIAHG